VSWKLWLLVGFASYALVAVLVVVVVNL